MHYAGAHVLAWMSLLVGTGTLIAAIGTDFWSTHRPVESVDIMSMHRGLWKQCTRYLIDTYCHNRFSKFTDDVLEVMRIGGFATAGDLFDGYRPPITAKKLQGICSACASIWYAHQNQMGQTLTFSVQQPDDLSLYRMHNQLAWSFYLAVCGSICQFLGGVFFACSRPRQSSSAYTHSV
ncbi:unnamed protein product [Anisakis simplex]|uniref:Claudin domain containing 1 n=1 Tax=Anisakis simplex TaxID=6269 RepID=A0A0M3JWS9_ANISI|nr:unnamed protein product [Anisakis simplex]